MSPISGLTNPPKSFLKLGQIRKGQMQEMTSKDGHKYTAPVDLDYFRVTFRPDCQEAAKEFMRVYGERPTRINIRFPFKTIEEVWDANYECYSRGGLIAKAGSHEDGTAYWIFYRDYESGEVLVRNGSPVGSEGIEFMKTPIDVTLPVYSYKNQKGETVQAFLEPVGRLQVVVPEIAMLIVGYLEFRPGSPKDIGAISRELAAIDMLARQAGRDISGIPMVLSRREETITKNIKGKLSQDESWMVHIEVQGLWGRKALTVLERNSSPDIVDGDIKELPMDEGWDGDIEEVKAASVPPRKISPATEPQEPESPPEPETEPVKIDAQVEVKKPTTKKDEKKIVRPYPPLIMREKFAQYCIQVEASWEKSGKPLEADSRTRQLVASALDKILGMDKLKRYEFSEFLTGQQSTSNMTPAQVLGLLVVLGIEATGKPDDFQKPPSDNAIKEIRAAHEYYKENMPAEEQA